MTWKSGKNLAFYNAKENIRLRLEPRSNWMGN